MTISPPEGCRWVDAPPPIYVEDVVVRLRVPPYLFPETCAHVGCRWVIPKWHTRIIPIGFERRAPLRRCRACYAAVDTAPLCCVVGATAPPRENISWYCRVNDCASNRTPPKETPDLRNPSRSMGCLRSGSRSGPKPTQTTPRERQ